MLGPGSVFLVTGAASGIGAATAELLVSRRYRMEQRDRRVTFTLVCPGVVDTPMFRRQYGIEAAALSFSAPAMLPEDIAQAILRGAEKKPLEILIPAFQGAQLRLAGVLPRVVRWMKPGAEARGWKAMSKLPPTSS